MAAASLEGGAFALGLACLPILMIEPRLDTGVDPPEPRSIPPRPRRMASKSPPAAAPEPQVDANEERAGRWQIAQWSTGRVQADVVAHLPADSAVIGPDGTVRKILPGNKWTPAELQKELEAAAAPKP